MSVDSSREAYEPRSGRLLTTTSKRRSRLRGVVRNFAGGGALFHENQLADRVLVLRSGFVKLSCYSDDGREVVLGIRGPGDVIGELSALDGAARSATVIALESVEAFAIPTGSFNDFLESHPRVLRVLLQVLAGRLRDADRRRVEFAAKETMGRVASRIVELSERFGAAAEGDIRIEFPLTQEELAGWTACSRDSVVKALQSMRDLGWIETGRKRITVHDLAAVRRTAGLSAEKAARRLPDSPTEAGLIQATLRGMGAMGNIGEAVETVDEAWVGPETARFAQAARLLRVGSWEWDISSGEVRWSAELYRIFGLDEDFVASYETYCDRIHPDDRERVTGLIANAVQTGVPLESEHRIVRPDGAVRTLHCRGEVVVAEDGSPVRLFGICQDITERKRIQDEVAIERELAFSVDAARCVEDALEIVLRRLCQYGDFALGQAWTIAGGAYLEFSAAWPSGSPLDAFTARSKAITFEEGSGLPGRAWAGRRPVWVEDVKSELKTQRASFAREVGIGAAMAVPIPSGERIVAVVEFFATESRPQDEAVSALVSRVATQLGPMLEVSASGRPSGSIWPTSTSPTGGCWCAGPSSATSAWSSCTRPRSTCCAAT